MDTYMLNKIINALKSKKSNQHQTQSESTVTSDAQPSKHEADIHASNDDTRDKKSEEELNVPKKTLNRDESSNEVPELTKVRPELRPEGLHGLIGEAALLLCDGFRALPPLVALSLMVRLSASIKRGNVVVENGAQLTEIRIFGLVIMRTGGGKGISEDRAELMIERSKLFSASEVENDCLFARVHEGGLSTSEGIASELKDATQDKNGEIVEGVSDKRLCIIEEEFMEILVRCRSNNSTLSSTIRKLFDGGDLSPMTKHDRVQCTSPHVCINAHITAKEFLKELGSADIFNGFSNRFLTIHGIPKPVIPFPKPLDEESVSKIAEELADVISWCNSSKRVITLGPCFRELWVKEVHRISELGPADSLEATLMVRAPHYAIIISGLFAAMEKTTVLTKEHLVAALSWIDYWHESIRYVFNTEAEAVANEERKKRATMVLNAIKSVVNEQGVSSFQRTLLTKKLGRKINSKLVNEALQDLQELPLTPIRVSKTGKKNCQMITLL